MSTKSLVRVSHATARVLRASQTTGIVRRSILSSSQFARLPAPTSIAGRRPFSLSAATQIKVPKEGSDWSPPTATTVTYTVTDITDNQYREVADEYMEMICTKFEELQDEREDVDVEYSAGVLSITFPAIGTYVVNKQPPNKQIWLSSPLSGPKRFDYVIIGDSQQDKQETSTFGWLCMRDKTALSEVFLKETGVDLTMPVSHYGE